MPQHTKTPVDIATRDLPGTASISTNPGYLTTHDGHTFTATAVPDGTWTLAIVETSVTGKPHGLCAYPSNGRTPLLFAVASHPQVLEPAGLAWIAASDGRVTWAPVECTACGEPRPFGQGCACIADLVAAAATAPVLVLDYRRVTAGAA